jgi:hypothetical protein
LAARDAFGGAGITSAVSSALMDDRERASKEAWKRLDNLRAEAESGRFRRGSARGALDSCLMNCGGTVVLLGLLSLGAALWVFVL